MDETEQNILRRNNKSGYTGVSWDKTHNAYQVRYNYKGVNYWLGYYKSVEYASLVYQNFKTEMEKS